MTDHINSDNRLTFHTPGSIGWVLGGIIIFMGLVFQFVPSSEYNLASRIFFAGLGIACFVMAMDFMLPSCGAAIDFERALARSWRRRLVFFKRIREVSLADVKSVAAGEPVKVEQGFRLYLTTEANEQLTLEHYYQDRLDARIMAEEIGKACNLPMLDTTTGREIQRDTEDLKLGHAGRIKRDGAVTELRPGPDTLRCSYDAEDGVVFISIPPVGVRLKDWTTVLLSSLAIAIVISFYAWSEWPGDDKNALWFWVFLAVMALLIWLLGGILLGIDLLRKRLRRVYLTCSSEGIYIEAKAPGWSRDWFMPAGAISELEIIPAGKASGSALWLRGDAIFVQGYDDSVSFGWGLEAEELRWMKDVLNLFMFGRTVAKDGQPARRDGDGKPVTERRNKGKFLWNPKIRTSTSLNVRAVAALFLWSCVIIITSILMASHQAQGARQDRQRRQEAAKQQEEFDKIAGEFERVRERAAADIERDLTPIQESIGKALGAGDLTFADRLWISTEQAEFLKWPEVDRRDARQRLDTALQAFANSLKNAPGQVRLLPIEPRPADADADMIKTRDQAFVIIGYKATFGFRLESADGAAGRIDFIFYRIGLQWRLAGGSYIKSDSP